MAVLLACLTFVSTGLGGLAALRFRDRLHLLLGFSAGAVLGVVFFETVLPWMLAFFSGFFLYMSASDLLPEAREHDSPWVGITTAAGMLVVFLVTRALPR